MVHGESVKTAIFPICFPPSKIYSAAVQMASQYLSSIVGAMKATKNQEGKGVTIWISDVDCAAAIFHSFLSRPVGVDLRTILSLKIVVVHCV